MTVRIHFISKLLIIHIESPFIKHDWRDGSSGMLNAADFIAWDKGMKRKLGWRAGLKFFSKTSSPRSWTLVSRHWPHLLCWDWSVWAGFHRGKLWDGDRRLRFVLDKRHAELNLFGPYIRYSWQRCDYMAGMNYKKTAPEPIWSHAEKEDAE